MAIFIIYQKNIGVYEDRENERNRINLDYQMLLYKTLRLCLEKLNRRGLTLDQQEFLETYLAIAYFRIPEFRSKILECLPNEQDIHLDEWKTTHFSLDSPDTGGIAMPALFNWDKEFYDRIPKVFF